jgi:N4-gp56 family major capsid protein
MALTVSATDTELPKPVNVVFQQTLLRNAKVRCPYFLGTVPGDLQKNAGTATVSWRRIENLSASTTALTELTVEASYMQGRSSAALSVSAVTATVSKYGNFVIINEEADVFNFNGQMDKIMEVIGINAGQSLNQLQRNITEDNLTAIYASGTSDGDVDSKIRLADIRNSVNAIEKLSALTFTPMTTGSTNIATAPILPAYIGLTHPDVAIDISLMASFKSVESYAGQVSTYNGEFGAITVAGKMVRFISSEDSSVDADAGATLGATGLNGTSSVDLYSTCIYGQDCIGSVGFGNQYPDGTYMAGDELGPIELIVKGLGSGGTSDPYNEIMTIAWKAWHTGAILNANWGRVVRSGATSLT